MLFIFVTDLINAGKFSTIYNGRFMNVRNARLDCYEKKHICIFLT